MDFKQAWRRVAELEGAELATDHGRTFRYRFHKTFVVVEPGGHSIPRTNFEKVHRGAVQPVQGQRYIRAIYDAPGFSER
jgi:hypothetical protein